jgi:hypothetical protein
MDLVCRISDLVPDWDGGPVLVEALAETDNSGGGGGTNVTGNFQLLAVMGYYDVITTSGTTKYGLALGAAADSHANSRVPGINVYSDAGGAVQAIAHGAFSDAQGVGANDLTVQFGFRFDWAGCAFMGHGQRNDGDWLPAGRCCVMGVTSASKIASLSAPADAAIYQTADYGNGWARLGNYAVSTSVGFAIELSTNCGVVSGVKQIVKKLRIIA